MKSCVICKKKKAADVLGVCETCIKTEWKKAEPVVKKVHARSRARFGLPTEIPRKGVLCGLCANNCRIPEGKKGYCGLTVNRKGRLIRLAGSPEKGLLRYYYDALPTNCVSAWACAATGCGYPRYSTQPGQESGNNLAVFYGACSFNCLFCQNWDFREMTRELKPLVSAKDLATAVTGETRCICFFGGDPAVQLPHAIATARIAFSEAKQEERILRVCLETNGLENSVLLKQFARIALESGGTIKFDLKFWNEKLAKAISGVSNKNVYKNFLSLGKLNLERKKPPLLTASTLLVPHYVTEKEVSKIANFVAGVDPDIPYSLLAFYPAFEFTDLPTTSWEQARKCHEAAKEAGLRRVRIGNIHLLR